MHSPSKQRRRTSFREISSGVCSDLVWSSFSFIGFKHIISFANIYLKTELHDLKL